MYFWSLIVSTGMLAWCTARPKPIAQTTFWQVIKWHNHWGHPAGKWSVDLDGVNDTGLVYARDLIPNMDCLPMVWFRQSAFVVSITGINLRMSQGQVNMRVTFAVSEEVHGPQAIVLFQQKCTITITATFYSLQRKTPFSSTDLARLCISPSAR